MKIPTIYCNYYSTDLLLVQLAGFSILVTEAHPTMLLATVTDHSPDNKTL